MQGFPRIQLIQRRALTSAYHTTMSPLLSLPNEILNDIISQLVPDFIHEAKFANREEWRRSEHIGDLRSLSCTCKHLSALVRPHFYSVVVLDYPTCMIRLLRTLIENPAIRDMVRTMAICCPLHYCDDIADPFAPRETFLDDNPELKLDIVWDTDSMDDYAAAVFRSVGLDRDEYKRFTEYELEALNDGTYWMSIPDFSERIGYENALMQGLAMSLIAFLPRLEHLIMPRYQTGPMYDFDGAVDRLVKGQDTKERMLTRLSRLELRKESYRRSWPWEKGSDCLDALLRIPAIKRLVDGGHKTENEMLELWKVRAL
ncbi:hypothetical protein TWF696_001750 [Orbilia brochopaga]|uniref:F-box domain-containing protein n=1 Tax=Orbilia brochopaga TaxID=3140254 RepID=A0AAV9U5N5_9PEZI